MLVKNNKPPPEKKAQDAAGSGGDSWFPLHMVGALSHAVEAERQAPHRKDVIKILREIRATGEFNEEDQVQVELLEPDFYDRYSRTPERTRKRADVLLKDYLRRRPGKHGRGSGRYLVRPEGIGAPTLCAIMISVKFDWPAETNRQAREFCQRLWMEARGDVDRRGGRPNRADGFWRDHLRKAQEWRDTPIARSIQSYL